MGEATQGYEQDQTKDHGGDSDKKAADTDPASADSSAAGAQSGEVNAGSQEAALTEEQQQALIKSYVESGTRAPYRIADEVFYATWPHMTVDGEKQALPSRKTATAEQLALIDSYKAIHKSAKASIDALEAAPAPKEEETTEPTVEPEPSSGNGDPAPEVDAGAAAEELIDRYATKIPFTNIVASLDEEGLAGELVGVIGQTQLVRDVFNKLSYTDTDDVAYYLTQGLDDGALAGVDRSLLEYLKTQLEGGVSTPSEAREAGRIDSALNPETSEGGEEETDEETTEGGEAAPAAEHFVVTDGDARIRTPPDELKSTGDKIPKESKVVVIESTTKGKSQYSKVRDLDEESKEWGWTSHGNLTDGAIFANADKYGSAEGSGQTAGRGNTTSKNRSALKKSRDTGKAFTPRDMGKKYKKLEGQDFVDAADAEMATKDWTKDQAGLITAAKEFAAAPKTLTGTQQANAAITFSKTELDGISLNGELKSRLQRFQQFIAWAGLVSGPTTSASAMRSPKTAHKLSTGWMYSTNNNKSSSLGSASNRKKLAANLIVQSGTDTSGNTWASAATITELKAAGQDDAKLKALLPKLREDAAKVQVQNNQAAEGFTDAASRMPNVLPGSGVSNHLKGLAVDAFHMWIFANLFDPMIDAIALYFGIYRACKDLTTPEHWHYELLGTPPGPTEGEKGPED